MNIVETIRNRRTHKLFDGNEVSEQQINTWLSTAVFAPNHRRNEPWNFILITHEKLEPFWQKLQPVADSVLASLSSDVREMKKSKMAKLFRTAGALLFVTSALDENPLIEKENYAAVSCAIQNLMLLAEADGVGSFWSTSKVLMSATACKLIGYSESSASMAGAIFLGKACGSPTPPTFQVDGKLSLWAEH